MYQAVEFDDAAKARIKTAAAFERRLRLESFLNVKSDVCGFKLRCPTIRDVMQLEFVENRIATGEFPQPDDYAHLVFQLTERKRFQSVKKLTRKVAQVLKTNPSFRHEVVAFWNAQFNDMPRFGNNHVNEFDSSVWTAYLIDTLASQYGWSVSDILDVPVSVAFQLYQRILKRENPKYAIRNGITQQAKAEEMKGLKHG